MPTLQQILVDALHAERRSQLTLRGGLILIAYPPAAGTNQRRLVAVRRDSIPGDKELEIIRRELLLITQDQPLTTIGDFQRLTPNGPWNAAEVHINAPPAADGR